MTILKDLENQLEGKDILESLQYLSERFEGEIVFSTSFGIEDQVITYNKTSQKPLSHPSNVAQKLR